MSHWHLQFLTNQHETWPRYSQGLQQRVSLSDSRFATKLGQHFFFHFYEQVTLQNNFGCLLQEENENEKK